MFSEGKSGSSSDCKKQVRTWSLTESKPRPKISKRDTEPPTPTKSANLPGLGGLQRPTLSARPTLQRCDSPVSTRQQEARSGRSLQLECTSMQVFTRGHRQISLSHTHTGEVIGSSLSLSLSLSQTHTAEVIGRWCAPQFLDNFGRRFWGNG